MPSYKHLITGAILLSLSASYPMAASCMSVPDTITLNQNGKLYQPFQFNHAKHIQDIKECADCHHHTTGTLVQDPKCVGCHANSSPTEVVSCKGCHSKDPFTPQTLADKHGKSRFHLDKLGIKGAMHQSCLGCHKEQGAGPVGCKECHPGTKEGDAFMYSGKVGTAKPAHE
jgi:hypothetical protein